MLKRLAHCLMISSSCNIIVNLTIQTLKIKKGKKEINLVSMEDGRKKNINNLLMRSNYMEKTGKESKNV